MKRTYRIVIVLIPIIVILIGVSIWRFQHIKNQETDPKKVYRNTPSQPNILSTNDNKTQTTPEKNESNTDVDIKSVKKTEDLDEIVTSEETDDSSNPMANTIGDIPEKPDISPEEAAAQKEFEEAQTEYDAAYAELKPVLKAKPIDFDAIGVVNEKIRKAAERRLAALENLAVYSDEAFDELLATITRQEEAKRIMDEIPTDTESISKSIQDLRKTLEDFKTMTTEERKRALEKLTEVLNE